MQLNRTQNTVRNITWGVINKLIKILFPFVIRTIIIYRLGVKYVGLNSLFTSILSTLSLAELGFDTAIVTVMYKSVAENDNDNLCALLNFIKKAYLIVGTAILGMGMCCLPFLKYLIKDYNSIPSDMNLYVLFIMFLLNTVVSYFFGGYRNCVLEAYQRQDIVSNVNSFSTILFGILQIGILFISGNYYLYLVTMIISNVFINFATFYQAKKNFPRIIPKGSVKRDEKVALKRVLVGTFYARVGSVLSVSFDNIVISSFLGLTILAYYSNYSYIITAIQGFLIIIYASMQAGIGNSVTLDSVEKNYEDMVKFTFGYNWIVGWCSICLIYLFKPFISLWVGNKGVLPDLIVVLIVLDFYIVLSGGIIGIYKNALAIWWEDRYRCIIGGIFNLTLNICMVLAFRKYGDVYALAGVLLSTILADLLILTPWAMKVTFDKYFKKGIMEYAGQLIMYFIVTILNIAICYPAMNSISRLFDENMLLVLFFRMIVLIILPNIVYLIIYSKTKPYKLAKKFLKTKINSKMERK